jgi:hypothetical protein
VRNSHLSDSDKQLVIGRIPFVAEVVLEMFVAVCEEDPFGLDVFAKSLKAKLEAGGNLKKLHEVIEKERIELETALVVARASENE